MTRIEFNCDRCGQRVSGLHTPSATAGFYVVSEGKAWAKYALNEQEHFVCDACIQSMPDWQAVYGEPPAAA